MDNSELFRLMLNKAMKNHPKEFSSFDPRKNVHLPFQGELLLDDGGMLQIYEAPLSRQIGVHGADLVDIYPAGKIRQGLGRRELDRSQNNGLIRLFSSGILKRNGPNSLQRFTSE